MLRILSQSCRLLLFQNHKGCPHIKKLTRSYHVFLISFLRTGVKRSPRSLRPRSSASPARRSFLAFRPAFLPAVVSPAVTYGGAVVRATAFFLVRPPLRSGLQKRPSGANCGVVPASPCQMLPSVGICHVRFALGRYSCAAAFALNRHCAAAYCLRRCILTPLFLLLPHVSK